MKIFDHEAKYTDEEMLQFFNAAEHDDDTRKRLMKFYYGFANPPKYGTEPKGKDPSYWKEICDKFHREGVFGIIRNPQVQLKRATEVPLIHDVMAMEAKAKEDLMTGPIPIHPELVKDSTPYIFNREHMTKDDYLIVSRRAITCTIARPIVRELGNDYCEQIWIGDITKWPYYVEYDEEFK